MQRLLSLIRRADTDFGLIRDGERVAVGVSGGKDSLTLLCALARYRAFATHPFTLTAVTIDMGLKPFDLSGIAALCASLEVPYIVERTHIGDMVRNSPHPCSLCARLRKGTLTRVLNENGITALALGHHRDDAIETFMLSLLKEGRVHTFEPRALLSRSGIMQIRPMIYAEEVEIAKLSKRLDLPVVPSPCPVDGETARADIRRQIESMEAHYPDVRDKLMSAVRGLWSAPGS